MSTNEKSGAAAELEALDAKRTALEARFAEERKELEAKEEFQSRIRMVAKVQGDMGKQYAPKNAKACPNCGQQPIGMLKTPAHTNRGVDIPEVIEVGCIFCPPFYVKSEKNGVDGTLDGKKGKYARKSYSARANSLEDATKKWNEGNLLEDTEFGLNVRPEEHARFQR